MFSIFDIAAMLLTLSALFGWLNRRYLRLPHAIGMLAMGLAASVLLVGLQVFLPSAHFYEPLINALRQIDFSRVVMDGMLAFILFAGAMNVDLERLKNRRWQIAFLALVGTAISTVLVGLAFWWASALVGTPVPLPWALVFGALISPTDPIAVLATLKHVAVPQVLEAETQGEALFNDGVGVVFFSLLLSYAAGSGGEDFGITQVFGHLFREALGGIVLGTVTGYVAYRAMRAIDDFPVEVLITLALVMSTYAVANTLGTSGPLSVVAAGLLVGYRAPRFAMSQRTQTYVTALWTLVDEVLNSILFLLIGLEVLVINFQPETLPLAVAAIPIVLAARTIAVGAPLAFDWGRTLSPRNLPFLVWAGVHGGISVALALAMPDSDYKPLLLTATYAVVLFSIIVQGATLGLVARRTLDMSGVEPAAPEKQDSK